MVVEREENKRKKKLEIHCGYQRVDRYISVLGKHMMSILRLLPGRPFRQLSCTITGTRKQYLATAA
jgi:hypothetical protein